MNNVSVVVLTKNSSSVIQRCLESLDFASEIIIIDDYSTDETIKIAKKYTDKLFLHSLNNNFSEQRNFGLKHARNNWVLFIDSDEVVSKELAKEIMSVIDDEKVNGFYLVRLDKMWGKTLRHGDNNVSLLRLGKKGKGEWDGKVHETWGIGGETSRLDSPLIHFPHPTVAEFLREINFYSRLRANELFEQNVALSWYSVIIYPKAKFLNLYILKLGILDGIAGLMCASMMSFYSFLVRVKLWQLYGEKRA